ncbi:hypothetical protein V8E36_001160 [Tilletia maclaganii]
MATSPGAGTTVPSYNLSQDDHTIQVRIHCPLAPPNSQPNVVIDGQIFGFTCPKMGPNSYYLPLYLPMPCHSPTLVRDPSTSALIVTLRKNQPGLHIPELSLLQPALLPDVPFLSDAARSGEATPVSPPDTLDHRQGYIGNEFASYLGTSGEPSPALSPSPAAQSASLSDAVPVDDPDVSLAADELIALGIKNENDRRRAQGQSPLIIATDDSANTTLEHPGLSSRVSHTQKSSEASTMSSGISYLDEDDLAPGRNAIAGAGTASPTPAKTHAYGFRAAFTTPFIPSAAGEASGTGSISASTIEATSGTASPLHIRSKVHELQQDVRRLTWAKRRKVAKLREEEKWDEGRYLDGYVDEFGEVAEILAWEPEHRLSPSAAYTTLSEQAETEEYPSPRPFDKTSREAHLAALQFLFAYAYDWRTTQGEHNVESEWTLSVLCRSLVTQCQIEPASPVIPRAISPNGSTASGMNRSSTDFGTSSVGPRAISPALSLSGGPALFPRQSLDGAVFSSAGQSRGGTPTLLGSSPERLSFLAGLSAVGGPGIPMSIGVSTGVATLGRRPASIEIVGSPPRVGSFASPPMSGSLSGSLAAPRRASGLSVSSLGPGGSEYAVGGSGGGGVGVAGVHPSSSGGGGGAGGRSKLPLMRDEPELDTPLSILRASYRRAITFPLHRSWALCEKVRDDVLVLLQAGLKAVSEALAQMEDRLKHAEDVVMHRYAEVWVKPVRDWLEHHGSDQSLALLAIEVKALSPDLTRDLVGGEVWDLELLEAAARDALDEGQGGYG